MSSSHRMSRPGPALALAQPTRQEAPPSVPATNVAPSFRDVYERQVAFVWGRLRRFGVLPAALADAAQDVFVVVYRRLGEIDAGDESVLRRWLLGIVVHVAQRHRRTRFRKDLPLEQQGALDP